MGILQPIESFVSQFYNQYPELQDHDVLPVYEALSKFIRAKLTNFPLPQFKQEDITSEIYAELLLYF